MKPLSRRTFLTLSALATATAFLPASLLAKEIASADWPSHGWDIEQTRNNVGETMLGPENVSRLELRWQLEAGSGITGTPAVVGDRVIVGSWDGRVYALDRGSGKSLWTFDAGVRRYPPDRRLGFFASPAVVGRTVYVVADRVLALDIESGKRLWERTIGDPEKTGEYFWAPPLVHAGRLYAGVSGGSETDTRGRVICLDTATGAVRWNFFTVAPDVAGGAVFAAPSLDLRTRTLYIATGSPFHVRPGRLRHSCSLIALDAATGALRWADQVSPHDAHNLDLNCPPMLLSVMHAGRRQRLIVVGGKDGLRAWDRETKQRLWRTQLTPALPPNGKEALPTSGPEAGPTAAADGLVFFASNNHQDKTCLIAAMEAATGELRWLHSLPAFEFGPMSVAHGVVYLGLSDGKLRAWRAHDGELLWESPAGPPIAGGPAIAHGMVFVGTGAGEYLPGKQLLAFALKR
jgi:polyvinyl alcohol dehydrogenase (cytochrome)